jgi:hypothetical protein
MARKEITLHQRTMVVQQLPKEQANKVANHIKIIYDLRRLHAYRAHKITAMDKTGLWLDMPGRTTLEEKAQEQCV